MNTNYLVVGIELAQDILLDLNNDLLINNGDFTIGDSNEQHIDMLLKTNIGDWKQSPLTGIGIENWLLSPVPKSIPSLEKKIREQLSFDGFQPSVLEITALLELYIDANRIR